LWARGPVDVGPVELLPNGYTLNSLIAGRPLPAEGTGIVIDDARRRTLTVMAPVDGQEVWAAGVTYDRSREARIAESRRDIYDLVYTADRPELFFKAPSYRVRGTGEAIRVRADSEWNVPEPELGIVCSPTGRIVAYCIGDDVSSRSIEGENPLYLPQAKYFDGSCALGPAIVPVEEAARPDEMTIELEVSRPGSPEPAFSAVVKVASMSRTADDLASWLFKEITFPHGAFLLTGTGIVPPMTFTLLPGDEVTISVTSLGILRNSVTS
jgi:2-dehydro-3-deoxy-D-arabinonate dehydratase